MAGGHCSGGRAAYQMLLMLMLMAAVTKNTLGHAYSIRRGKEYLSFVIQDGILLMHCCFIYSSFFRTCSYVAIALIIILASPPGDEPFIYKNIASSYPHMFTFEARTVSILISHRKKLFKPRLVTDVRARSFSI